MEKMPPSWARAILRYATIELSPTQIDKLIGITATDPEECFKLLYDGCNYQLSQQHVDKLVKGLGHSSQESRWLLEEAVKIKISREHVAKLFESLLLDREQSCLLLIARLQYCSIAIK